MTGSRVLIELVVVLGTAAVVTVLFQALRLPVVLGYVLAGLLIGPHVPVPLVANAALVHILSELGVILLMFTIGLELPLKTIARVGLPGALTALFEVGLVIAIGTLVAHLLGFDSISAFFVGACLGISSTMLVAKAFEEIGWKGGFTEIVFAVLVFEDLIAILILAIVAAVASGQGLDAPDLAIMLGKLAGFLVLMLVGGLLIVPRAVRWIAQRARRETLAITALAVCFGTSTLASQAGYSVALGAFIAGVLIAESGRGHDVFQLVLPFRDIFAMVFFVSVGMTIDPAELAIEAPQIAAFTAVVLLAKPVAISVGVFLAGHGINPAVRSGLSLAQIGEFSFVIATVAGGGSLLAIAVGVSCATTLTSPLLIRNSQGIASWVSARLPPRMATFVSFYESWLARLRSREGSTWKRYRRGVLVLVLDAGVLVTIVIAASTVGPDLLVDAGLTGHAIPAVLLAASAVLAAPFAISMIRRIALLSRRLALEVIPAGEPVDLGRAPRRALIVTFELAMSLVVAVPIVVAVQPFVPGSLALVLVVALVLLLVMRRSIADFEGHVRAGSELILELMSHPQADMPLSQVETILPGFGGTASVALGSTSPAIGRSLAQLDLRARTGATVLAIGRGEHGLATPSPTEPLQAGDVLALAGSDEAIAAARRLLATDTVATDG
ncbi:MAG: cation:proton antiporter [Deltaproteobacteria bacterium]|nr:cation:proton antiporter [Deltaproteobacteria bacterium]MDQ3297808.1 cation:proton antiporter [Myxococcota bacterium]